VWDSGPGLGVESGLETFFDKPLPHSFHGSRSDVQCLHNLLVGTPETLRAGIGQKQNAGVVQSAGCCLPDRHQLPQLSPFLLSQRNPVLLFHRGSPYPAGCPATLPGKKQEKEI
jgi:hypothetical protein